MNDKYTNLNKLKIALLVDENIKLTQENKQLKELCDTYEEEHKTTFKTWQKDIKKIGKAINYIKDNEQIFIALIGTHYYKLLEILGDKENE